MAEQTTDMRERRQASVSFGTETISQVFLAAAADNGSNNSAAVSLPPSHVTQSLPENMEQDSEDDDELVALNDASARSVSSDDDDVDDSDNDDALDEQMRALIKQHGMKSVEA